MSIHPSGGSRDLAQVKVVNTAVDHKFREQLDIPIDELAERYLRASAGLYQPGQEEYYLRKSLEQAVTAYKEGNFGIGAVAILVHNGMVYEFPARNAMLTGQGLHDHAETRALEDMRRYAHQYVLGTNLPEPEVLRAGPIIEPSIYSKSLNEHTRALKDGVFVYGTLEPCPLCMCCIGYAGAKGSVSSVLDGRADPLKGNRSDGAAMVVGDKRNALPFVWDQYIFGDKLQFTISNTADEDLKFLSERIFTNTRAQIDQVLADRKTQCSEGLVYLHKGPDPEKAFDIACLNHSLRIIHDRLRQKTGREISPKAAIVLGTGFESLPEQGYTELASVPYGDIPFLKVGGTVSGHAGKVVLMERQDDGTQFMVWRGRFHAYQLEQSHVRTPLVGIPFVSARLGANTLITCQGVGGLRAKPGTLFVVNDYDTDPSFNLFPGPHQSIFRDEFAPVAGALDEGVRAKLLQAMADVGLAPGLGGYHFWMAKTFQSPADIQRVLKSSEASVIGKSGMPEAIYGSQLGLKVGSICLVTNFATGLGEVGPSHGLHRDVGKQMAPTTTKVLGRICDMLATEKS